MPDDCLFCRIANGGLPARKVWENDEFLAFHDIQPAAPVHVLLIPRRHIPRLDAAAESDAGLLGRWLLAANAAAKAAGLSDFRLGVNCGADAGQTVFHLHAHILGGRKFLP